MVIERRGLTETCEDIILNVQSSLYDYFTFDIRIIGSGEKRLVTKNGNDGSFDLDYNLILQKDKKGLLSYPEKIKNLFMEAFNDYAPTYGFKSAQNSSSVITSKHIYKSKVEFSFDIAILIEGNNGNYYKLIFDKRSNHYIWNEIKNTRNYQLKYKKVKQSGKFPQFKKRYLELKKYHLSRQDGVKSFSVFLETLNEFY